MDVGPVHFWRLQHCLAIVTGASRGIGKGIALALAAEGARVVITYRRNLLAAQRVERAIREQGGEAIICEVDIASRSSVQALVRGVLNTYERIDILVNNAGILQQKPFEEITDEDWDSVFSVNMKGTFICTQEVFAQMKRQLSGVIVNMASSGGQLGGPLAVHYSASKAGIICFTKSLARVGSPYNIRVNAVAPGLVDTEMSHQEIVSEAGHAKLKQMLIQRPATIEEIAAAVVFLASNDASYVTGHTLNVNGGLYLG